MTTLPFTLSLAATSQTGTHVLQSFGNQGAFSIFICLLVLVLSLVSWMVIFMKIWQFHQTRKDSEKFMDAFKQLGGDFGTINDRAERCRKSPMASVFREVFQELNVVARIVGENLRMTKPSLELVERRAERVIGEQVADMEKHLVFLATATNVCPFLGLLGTVWGLLGCFGAMGTQGSANLAVVGTGVAEALVTTLVGLLAAIPASFFYNYFQHSVNVTTGRLEAFSSELISRLSRNAVYYEVGDKAPRHRDRAASEDGVMAEVGRE